MKKLSLVSLAAILFVCYQLSAMRSVAFSQGGTTNPLLTPPYGLAPAGSYWKAGGFVPEDERFSSAFQA